jgi:hypothetical protein
VSGYPSLLQLLLATGVLLNSDLLVANEGPR